MACSNARGNGRRHRFRHNILTTLISSCNPKQHSLQFCLSALLLVVAIVGGITIQGLLIWTLIRLLFTVLSGWKQLASRYGARRVPACWHWSGQTVRVGSVRYRRCMRVAAESDGLYLAGYRLLRHPPLCIPWSEIHDPATATIYGRPAVSVSVGTPPSGKLEFPLDLYSAIWTWQGRTSR